jgi:CheY-like chemotaxis protein
VLLVEDHKGNQLVAQKMLEQMNLNVVLAENGLQAVQQMEMQDFGLVFMDIQMPVMDGFEALSRIRSMPPPKNATPVVAMTAHAMKEDRENCLNAGMNDYLAKPIIKTQLHEIVEKFLGA